MALKDHDKRYGDLNVSGQPNTVSRNLKTGDRSYSQVVYQSGKPVLDSELNHSQNLLEYTQHLIGKHLNQSGFLRGQTRFNEYKDFFFDHPGTTDHPNDHFRPNAFHMKRCEATVAGFPVVVEFTNTEVAGDNLIQLRPPTPYSSGGPHIKRTDFVFLEVWQALVAPSIKASGTFVVNTDVATGGDALTPGDAITLLVPANIGGTGVPTTITLVEAGPGLNEWEAGANDIVSATNLAAAITEFVQGVNASTSGTTTITIKAEMPGDAGNFITKQAIVANAGSITPSPLMNFSGGDDRGNKPQSGAGGAVVQDKIWRHGNVHSPQPVWLDDDLVDPVIDQESGQRVQVQYRIRVTGAEEGVNFKMHPDGFSNIGGENIWGQGSQDAPVKGYPFVPADHHLVDGNPVGTERDGSSAVAYGVRDDGLWIAGDGSADAATNLGSVDGFVYAIPICFIFRRNESQGPGLGFDPYNNTNGAPLVGHDGYTGPTGKINPGKSDRPDGAFADAINPNDIMDLRRHVVAGGVDLRSELQYQMQSLMDGSFRTWAIDGADKHTLGGGSGDVSTRHLVCNEIGRDGALDPGGPPIAGDTLRGKLIRNFDHICRRFADQPVTERVVFAFWPGDRPQGDGHQVFEITHVTDTGTPATITVDAPHGLIEGDVVKIYGSEFIDETIDGVHEVFNLTETTFDIRVEVHHVPPGAKGGYMQGVGIENDGKFVHKVGGSPYRWHEGDVLEINLERFDGSSLGGIFDGREWKPSANAIGSPMFSKFAPAGTVITDILSIRHDDGHYSAQDMNGNPLVDPTCQPAVIEGMGTQQVKIRLDANDQLVTGGLPIELDPSLVDYNPEYTMVRSNQDADATQGSPRRVFVEVEITYPIGVGLTDTPDHLLEPDQTCEPGEARMYPYGHRSKRNSAIIENQPAPRPKDMIEPLGSLFRDGFREVNLEYVAGDDHCGDHLHDDLVSVSPSTVLFPRRVYGSHSSLVTVSDLTNGAAKKIDVDQSEFGSSSRKVLLDVAGNGADLNTPLSGGGQTRVEVSYFAQDPIPNYGGAGTGYQIGVYYRTNAPQTAGTKEGDILAEAGGTLPAQLKVEPLVLDEQIWTGQVGMGSVSEPFPYTAPLDQIPIHDGFTLDENHDAIVSGDVVQKYEWWFCATSSSSVDDFDANTGLLSLHSFVQADSQDPLTLGGEHNDHKPRKDAEFRSFYPFADDSTYRPTIISQPLSGITRHKVFTPMLCRAMEDARGLDGGLLFRKNELLLVVLSRFAELDEDNSIRFIDPNNENRTGAAIYRTRNMLLVVGD